MLRYGVSFRLAILALVHFTSFSLASSKRVDVETLRAWVQQNSLSSVEDLLARLPETYRKYVVLVYDSKSRHRATLKYPRMVFYGPDAKLLTSVSTVPGDVNRNRVELIQFNSKKAAFEFYELDFEKAQPKIIQESSCVRCHRRSDPRPNWEPYNLWPGVFGGIHDKVFSNSLTHKHFEALLRRLRTSKNDSRLKYLVAPYHMGESTHGIKKNYYTISGHGGSNSILTLLLNNLNRDRITRLILESKDHEKYKFAILSSLAGCQDEVERYLPEEIRRTQALSFAETLKDTGNKIYYDFKRRAKRVASFLGWDARRVVKKSDQFGLRLETIKMVAKLRYLLEMRQKNPVAVKDWSLAVHQTSFDFNDGANGIHNLIGHYLPKAFPYREAFNEIAPKTTSMSISHFDRDHQYPHAIHHYVTKEPSQALCDSLRSASVQLLGSIRN